MSNKDKPRQLELFSGSVDFPPKGRNRQHIFNSYFTLSIEHVIVLLVVVLMIGVFTFSLGVEKGKRIIEISAHRNIQTVEKQIDKTIEVKKSPDKIPVKKDTFKKQGFSEEKLDFYTIQVASFKKRASVEKEASRLKDKGYDVIILPRGKWIALCVGKFSNKKEAEIVRKELKKRYSDCLIRSL